MEQIRRTRSQIGAATLLVLIAAVSGCSTTGSTNVQRYGPTGIERGQQISIILRHYQECNAGECKETLSEGIERGFASCIASSLHRDGPRLVRGSELRSVAFPNTGFEQSPRSVESLVPLLDDAEFRRRIGPLNLRYLVLLEVDTRVTSATTTLAACPGCFPMWGITSKWQKFSSFKAEILDLKAVRSSGIVTSNATGESGYMLPVLLIIPLVPIPYWSATESFGCEELGKAISVFIHQDPSR